MVHEVRPDAVPMPAESFFREENTVPPLYSPDFQFIELFGAHVKGYLAKKRQGHTYTKDRDRARSTPGREGHVFG